MNSMDNTPPSKPNPQPVKKMKSVHAPKRKRRGRGFLTFLLFIGIIAAAALFAWAEMQRRDALKQLEQTEHQLEEIKKSTQRSGQEAAQQVLEKVRSLMAFPTDPEPTVATITDVERLRRTSDFYQKAKNGDHLIITKDRAILFDPDRNIIVDVVPVRLEETSESEEGQTETTPTATPTPTASPPSEEEQPTAAASPAPVQEGPGSENMEMPQ